MNEPAKFEQVPTESTAADATPAPANRPAALPHADDGDAGYRLAESEPEPIAAPAISPALAPQETGSHSESTFEPAGETDDAEVALDAFPDNPPVVSEIWSRWSEWKEPLIWTAGGIGLAVLIMIGGVWIAALTFALSVGYGSYYLVISLPVPVRVTPEQAVREFYEAAGHRLPNFRRMFALLTAGGRESEKFSDFADFRAYWQSAVARLSRSPAWLVPLDFRVEAFRCRYNGDKTLAAVRYTLKVSPRGRPASDEPIAEFPLRDLAVKGPDGQWYLNDGTLPEPN